MRIGIANAQAIDQIMAIYDHARQIMRRNGNMGQWTNGYPTRELILNEINAQQLYAVTDDDGELLGVFSFIVGNEPTYDTIYEGEWFNDEPYGVVHRLATSGLRPGVGAHCINWCLEQHPHLRIDTHADNTIMQHLLLSLGFTRCGTIRLNNGDPRIAFQKERMPLS